MRALLLSLILLFGFTASASEMVGGVSAEVGFGSGGATIKNPDGTKAGYKVLSVEGRGSLPVFESEDLALSLTGGLRYLDLDNTANTGDQSEMASMIGPNAGLRLRAFKFFVAYEYNVMLARHYSVGLNSKTTQYSLPLMNLEAGLLIPFKQLSVSFSYSQAKGNVPKSGTGLSKDVPYNDQICWLQFTYSTGASFFTFLDYLF
ncbi:MAG: hypothetical protein KF799_14925 [Bdellovibrionales bacterium]|nr:hypothetical protein [Bdellovibrionales bacterium]